MFTFVKTLGLSTLLASGVCLSCDSAMARGGGCCNPCAACCQPAGGVPAAQAMDHSQHQAMTPTRERYQSSYQAPMSVPASRRVMPSTSWSDFRADRKLLGLYR